MRASLLFLAALAVHAETVQIIRDEFGVPHIFAATREGAAYAAGYAQAEDRLDALLRNLANLPDGRAAVTPLAEAYSGGINRFIQEHPETKSAAVSAPQVAAFAKQAFAVIRGSHDFMLGPSRTGNDGVIAVLDPLADWNADARPYEMRMYVSEGDIAISGFVPLGVPFPLVGHSAFVAVGWSGSTEPAGSDALTQAWRMITARNLGEVRSALEMRQIPGTALVGTAAGEIFDSGGSLPAQGYLMRPRVSAQADAMTRKLIASQTTWSAGRVAEIAFSTDVYKAETWQARLARVAPQLPFVRLLTGWNRRAEVSSVAALAFYLFKTELGREAALAEPPDSLSDGRIRAALDRAKDRLELDMAYGATFGSLFRVARDGGRESYPVGGGTVTDAAMETPRAITFARRGSVFVGTGGQTATQIVHLSAKTASVSVLMPGESDRPDSKHFDDQARELFSKGVTKPAYFADRRELERHASSRKELVREP
jgi:acyl-homoserine lactone acylase PvdQ